MIRCSTMAFDFDAAVKPIWQAEEAVEWQ